MGNKCKRFLVALMMVFLLVSLAGLNVFAAEEAENTELECYTYGDVNCDGVVDQKDALHLLYYCEFGEETYSLNGRGGDMDGDEDIDEDDAIHLLFHTFPVFAEEYPLPQGMVHEYAEPSWAWVETEEGMTATLTIACECTVEVMNAEVFLEDWQDPSCEENGYKYYSAVADEGAYGSNFEIILPAKGHNVVATCAGDVECECGGYTLKALDHTYEVVTDESYDATCGQDGLKVERCSVCGNATRETVIPATGAHKIEETTEQLTDEKGNPTCSFQDVQRCTNDCNYEVRSDVYEKHEYNSAVLKQAATCSAVEIREYTCKNCGSPKTETGSTDSSVHTWDGGAEQEDGNMLYTCSGCGETKVVVAVKNDTAIAKDDLKDKELSLSDEAGNSVASVAMSEDALEKMPEEVKVAVTDASDKKEELSQEQRDAIGDNKLYDFNVTDANGDKVEFNGNVTVTLPYKLGENENIDEIAVWFIDENGDAHSIPATYAEGSDGNGYITFTTDHFSYYTVTRLTPAERCKIYGHKYGTPVTVDPTCENNGYTKEVCQRCLDVKLSNEVKANGHNYVPTGERQEATCTESGWYTEKCENCDAPVRTHTIHTLGHDFQTVAEESVEATCSNAGKEVKVCSRCNERYEQVFAQKEHTEFETQTKPATCFETGYEKKVCKECKFEKDVKVLPKLAHSFVEDQNYADEAKRPTWNWNIDEDGVLRGDVTVTMHCANCDSTKDMIAVVHTDDKTNCEGGEITYTAKVSWNNKTYQDSKTQTITGGEHTLDKWKHNSKDHHCVCAVCGEDYNRAEHTWVEKSRVESTCKKKGEIIYECVCGRELKEQLEKAGEHNMEDGKCKDCGFELNTCKHFINNTEIIDLKSLGACGGWVEVRSCDCGQERQISNYELMCDMELTVTEAESENGVVYDVATESCADCGLQKVLHGYLDRIADPCVMIYKHYEGLFVGDQPIVESANESIMGEHPAPPAGGEGYVKVDLTEKGLCSEKLLVYSCPCGVYQYEMVEESCEWVFDPYESNDTMEYYVCRKCGAVKIWKSAYREEPENCAWYLGHTLTYYVDGEEVYSFTSESKQNMHAPVLIEYELYGESCEDGLWMLYRCERCGNEENWMTEYHEGITETRLDLSAYDICVDEVVLSTCLCEQKIRHAYTVGGCSWTYQYGDESENKAVYVCDDCSAVMEVSVTKGEKGSDCRYLQTRKETYFDKNGTRIVTFFTDEWMEDHNEEATYTLLGDTCEDGVHEIRKCLDCGKTVEDWTYHWHEVKYETRVDLRELNMCSISSMAFWHCACGERWEVADVPDDECDLYYVEGEKDHYVSKCYNCGVTRDEYTEALGDIDSCRSRVNIVKKFYNDSVTKTLSLQGITLQHDIETTIVLDEGSMNCEDGIIITLDCKNCDYEYSRTEYWHYGAELSRELLTKNHELCSDLYYVEYACPCGQDSWQNIEWDGESCNLEWRYFEDIDEERYICVNCDAYRVEQGRREVAVPNSCDVKVSEKYAYMRDGVELLTYENSWTTTYHDWQYTFNLYGETCDEGYDFTAFCANCDATDEGYGYDWHSCHGSHTKMAEREDICGTVWMYTDRCACGEQSSMNWNYSCHFTSVYDEALGRYVNQCVDCGLVLYSTSETSLPDEKCEYTVTTSNVFKLGDEILSTKETVNTYKEHDWSHEFELMEPGTTCENGYYVTQVCARCGYRSENTEAYYENCDLVWGMENTILDYDGNICNDEGPERLIIERYSCACGQNTGYWVGVNGCNFDHEDEYYCTHCDFRYYWDTIYSEPDEQCNVIATETLYISENGEYRAAFTYERPTKNHDWTRKFELFGETCSDGYTVTDVCGRCGLRGEYSETYYEDCYGRTWGMGRIDLDVEGKLCGQDGSNEFSVEPYTCACGKNTGYWLNVDGCGMEPVWDETLRREVQVCCYCGFTYYTEYTYGRPDDQCNRIETVTLYVLENGEFRAVYSQDRTTKEHNWSKEFELFYKTCADGYMITDVCVNCGLRGEQYGPGYSNCEVHGLEEIVVHDGEGLVGPCNSLYLRPYRCACGRDAGIWVYHYGGFESEWSDELGTAIHHCVECNLSYYESYTYGAVDENCNAAVDYTVTVLVDGEEYTTYTYNYAKKEHDIAYEFALHGESCEDGYDAYEVCKREGCDYRRLQGQDYNAHDIWNEQKFQLEDYDLCGGWIEVRNCACGQRQYVDYEMYCNYQNVGYDEELGTYKYYCPDCDTYFYRINTSVHDRENCQNVGRFYFQAIRNDEVLLTVEEAERREHHTYVRKDYVVNDGVTCENGWTGRDECYYCGTGYDVAEWYHDNRVVEYLDLSRYGSQCGGYLERGSCACGEYQDVQDYLNCNGDWTGERTEKDENGIVHTFNEFHCDDCGLKILEDFYTVLEEGSCNGTWIRSKTYTLGELNKTFTATGETTQHDWDDGIYVLEEGAKVCSDGITCIRTCQRCGATDEYHCGTSEHGFMNVLDDSIDLTQYGSVCGEWLLHLKCPCGAEERWDFDSENHCDLDQTEATSLYEDSYMRPWVEEVISRNELGGKLIHDQNGQPSSEGYRTTTSYGYVFTCAVTNPQCGMKVRMAEYWVVEDCMATEYQTWQLGYDSKNDTDPENDTWMHEVTVATGDKHAYHAYEDVDVPDETLDDGTYINTYKQVCADCGSYYQYQNFYKNDEQIKRVTEYINTKDNGENKSCIVTYEYGTELAYSYTHTDGTVYEGTERYETLEEYRYVKADGTEYWDKYEHIYSGENCMWSVVSTDSNGYYDAYDTTRHYAPGWFYETLEEATCSQPGLQRRYDVCYICHVKPNDDTFEITPDHSWDWDYEKQTYVCAVCELENINGADGSIIMEDLTEKYGNGENYVIGYYNRSGYHFSTYVSVIFDEWAEDREWNLEGIEITEHTKANDGFVGMSVNKQAAIDAALAKIAEQGYDGSTYAIRISLVPVNDEYDLDYAITFDSLAVAEAAE